MIVIAPHAKRTFVERLDFVTTVGHGDGAGRPASGSACAARARPR